MRFCVLVERENSIDRVVRLSDLVDWCHRTPMVWAKGIRIPDQKKIGTGVGKQDGVHLENTPVFVST